MSARSTEYDMNDLDRLRDTNPLLSGKSAKQSAYVDGMKLWKKVVIAIVILVVIVVIILLALGFTGNLTSTCPPNSSSTPDGCKCNDGYDEKILNGIKTCEPMIKCPPNSKLVSNKCQCDAGYTTFDDVKTCVKISDQPQPSQPQQNKPSQPQQNQCNQTQELYNGVCVSKCDAGQVRIGGICTCLPGTSGANCMILDTINGTPITSDNGYYVCKGLGLVWNGYKCIDTNKILQCPLKSAGNIICASERNVYWLHDSSSSDPYQCYNGMNIGGRVFGDTGSFTNDDRCMYGIGGATSLSRCTGLKTSLKC